MQLYRMYYTNTKGFTTYFSSLYTIEQMAQVKKSKIYNRCNGILGFEPAPGWLIRTWNK
jgi:hypothetical protein